MQRVVNFSSINALGQAEATHPGLYLPLDDDIPHYLARAYNTSKHVGEELCQAFSNQYGLTAVSLRPTAVLSPALGGLIYAALLVVLQVEEVRLGWAWLSGKLKVIRAPARFR